MTKPAPADLLEMLRAWEQIRRAPKPDSRTDPADLPDFDDDPYEAPDEIEEEFDVNEIGDRWWP